MVLHVLVWTFACVHLHHPKSLAVVAYFVVVVVSHNCDDGIEVDFV